VTTPRTPSWALFAVLVVIATMAALLYFGGDHRAGLMTAGEALFFSCLVYVAIRRRRAGQSSP
jgi:hypothetical protein